MCVIGPQVCSRVYWHFSFFCLHNGVWSLNWVHSARRPFIGLLYLPRVIVKMENLVEWIGRGNRSTRRKPAPEPLCPPQIPLDQTWARTRAAAVGSQRLTAWAMARPKFQLLPRGQAEVCSKCETSPTHRYTSASLSLCSKSFPNFAITLSHVNVPTEHMKP
jgi:hypothetical protein